MRKRRRRRGEGSVYFSDGSWIARYPLGSSNGHRRSKRVRCRTEREALAELERLRRSYGAGLDPATGTLSGYLRDWMAARGRRVRPSTRESYAGHIRNHLDPLLGGIPLVRLRPSDVRRLIDDLERKGLSPGSIHRVITTLRMALKSAVRERAIIDNPALVDLPRVEPRQVRALTEEEAERILDVVEGHWISSIVRVLLGTGMRLGEAIGLDQGDVLPTYVRVRISKTRMRAVPITEDAADALRSSIASAPRRGPKEPVFFGPRRKERLRGDAVTHAFPPIMEAAGLGHLTPHGLRHGAATLMLSAGIPMRAIADQLGHRNPSTTERVYAHVAPALRDSAIHALERRKGLG